MSRCLGCKKSLLRCSCWTKDTKPIREKAKVTDRNGRARTVTRNSKTARVDARGNEWCTACSCLVTDGVCANVTCSTRRA